MSVAVSGTCQSKYVFKGGDGCFADDVTGDPEFPGLEKHLRGHLFVAADEQEGCAGNVFCRGTGNQRADFFDGGFPVLRDLDYLHESFDAGPGARLPGFVPDNLQLAPQVVR